MTDRGTLPSYLSLLSMSSTLYSLLDRNSMYSNGKIVFVKKLSIDIFTDLNYSRIQKSLLAETT